jgi:hypothetical protein
MEYSIVRHGRWNIYTTARCSAACCLMLGRRISCLAAVVISMADSDVLAASVHLRAEEVSRSGRYLGLFDLLVWSELQQAQVLVLLGTEVLDLRGLCGMSVDSGRPVHCFVACQRTTSGDLLAVSEASCMNHWMIGERSGRSLTASPSSPLPPGTSVMVGAARVGWITKATNATGDCGPDVMAHWAGMHRGGLSWGTIRQRLSQFMVDNASVASWQAAFSMLGEAPAPRVVVPEASSASASACLEPVPSGVLPPLPPPPVLDVEDSSSEPEADCLAIVPYGTGTTTSAIVPSTSAVSAAAASAASSGEPRTFADWVASLDTDKQLAITKDYYAFKKAEDEWRADHPLVRRAPRGLPQRVKAASQLDYRLAVGRTFLRWRANEGRKSKSCYKDTRTF